jgi:hypothetical protein
VSTRYPAGIGPRVALFLRETYAQDRAKTVARQFRISISTAQRWLDGHAPTTAHLEAMCALWGAPFVSAVFVEAFGARDQHVAALVEARAKLMADLQHPSDPLETARRLQQLNYTWRWLWATPNVEASARVVQYSARVAPLPEYSALVLPPRAPSTMTVPELLNVLEETVPKPTFWGRIRERLLVR